MIFIGNKHARDSLVRGVCVSMLTCLLFSGCGSQEDIGLVKAEGTVTLDGQPLANAQVIFTNEKGPVYGRTDKNGHYEMEFSQTRKGAFLGENLVRISTKVVFDDMLPEELAEEDEEDLAEEGLAPKETVPDKFNTDSELTVTVTKGGSPYDFDLSSN